MRTTIAQVLPVTVGSLFLFVSILLSEFKEPNSSLFRVGETQVEKKPTADVKVG